MPSAHHPSAPPDGGTIDAWTLFFFFRDNAFILCLGVLLGLTVALAAVLWIPPVYAARAVLEVASENRGLADLGNPPQTDLGSASLLKTVEQLVGSNSVLERVVAAQHLDRDPAFATRGPADSDRLVRALARHVSVNLIRGTRLIEVRVTAREPERARRLAQAVVDQYFALDNSTRRDASGEAHQLLVEQAQRLDRRLHDAELRLQRYREENSALALNDQSAINVDRLRDLQERLNDARNRRLALESEQAQVQAALAAGDPERLLDLRMIAERPDVIELRKDTDAKAVAVAALASRYRAKHPAMIQARDELDESRRVLHQTARAAAESILQAYQAAQTTETYLQQEIGRQERAAVEFNRVAIPYRALAREVESDTALYQQLLARAKQTEVAEKMMTGGRFSGGYVRQVDRPVTPVEPAHDLWKIALPAGLAAGAMLGGLIALLRRAFDNTVPSVDAAEALLDANTLVVVPRSRRLRFHRGRAVPLAPGAADGEVFRSLRTALMLQPGADGPRAMMFTSALPGEGKSCCSSNFAMVMAHTGARTLLIDGDLRRPILRYAFDRCVEKTGLTDCLRHPDRFEAALDDTPVRNLFLLGNTFGTPHSAELLASGNLARILELSLARFDRVVIDTAPVAIVSDALHFARHVPAICLVVLAARTPRRIVRRVGVQLRAVSGRPIAGVVLNQIRPDHAASHYYYYSARRPAGGLEPAPAAG